MKRANKIQHWMLVDAALIVFDFVATILSYYLALWLRFDFNFSAIDEIYFNTANSTVWIVAIFSIICAYCLKLYQTIWRFASVSELLRGLTCTCINTIFCILLTVIFYKRMPISYYFIGFVLQFLTCTGIRFSYRFFLSFKSRVKRRLEKNNVMVIGAGEAGTMITKEINKETDDENVVCIIDDNSNKWGRYINGVPVVGNRNSIEENIRKYHVGKIVVAIPSAKKEDLNQILNIARGTKLDVKIIPSIHRFANESLSISDLRDVEITDLLGRDEIKTDLEEVFSFIKNKTVLVTGAGGSIGSELVRQIAANNPSTLVLLDIYENSTYFLELELKKDFPNLNLVTLIASVRDHKRIKEIFNTYKPDIVYHAAAHKHVPLMEDSPNEAIKNNCFGTLNVALAALSVNTSKFVLISTDKAVNPTNIMGASKRICEMIIQDFQKCVDTKKTSKLVKLYKDLYDEEIVIDKSVNTLFSAVRFGNVLGSNGSVVPIFKEQIAKGGPVTITHPDITRFFMTIPEAVSLVLQASVYASGGEIFVLDMGEPVKIVDLANNLIKLSGKEGKIEIKYTGLRPGEKLYEERLMDIEDLRSTPNKLISIAKPLDVNTTSFFNNLKKLYIKAYKNDSTIEDDVCKMVDTYISIK